MNQQLDELHLQRLVDGVLSDAERREFLERLEGRPDHWREVALAFVEDQIWADVVSESEPSSPRALPPKPAAPIVAQPVPWLQWGAVAACLLVMLGVGMWVGRRSASGPVASPDDGPRIQDQIVHTDRNGAIGDPNPLAADQVPLPERLEIEYGDGPSRKSLMVPVVHESQLPGHGWNDDPYSAEMERINRELASAGYRIEWQTEYLGGNLSGGNQLVVPVRAISLRQRGQ